MATKPDDLYGTGGSVAADVSENGSGASSMGVHADASDFGGQVGQAEQGAGQAVEKVSQDVSNIATEFARTATEAKANDTIINQVAPAAADLRSTYDKLDGPDKVNGYHTYVSGLQNLNSNFIQNATSPYEKQILGSWMSRHISQEIDGASREMVANVNQNFTDGLTKKTELDSMNAANNYNNPAVVDQSQQSINGNITLQYMHQGYDPTNPDHAAVIDDAQRQATGNMASGMINRALQNNDPAAANDIRAKYSTSIAGYQQLPIDNTLHVANMNQTGTNGSQALQKGQPIPPSVGVPVPQVQAAVAKAAQDNGIDPNHALTVAWIESKDGQNVGKRGDIGQTGKPATNIEEQASNMAEQLKESQQVATNALQRPAEPWEQYMCYQQGSAGGTALLKATNSTPDAKAVDVLTPFYGSSKVALSAIVNNGGNATMSASDFSNFIKQKYNDNAARAQSDIPPAQSVAQANPTGSETVTTVSPSQTISDAFLAPHQQTGPVVQPAASPRQALDNFDNAYPDMVARANQIPNLQARQAVLNGLKTDRGSLAAQATAYSGKLITQAQQLAVDPTFTDMNQVPPDMAASLLENHPDTITYLRNAAISNQNKSSGGISEEDKHYGSGAFDLMRQVHNGTIKSSDELMAHLPGGGKGDDLTMAGYDRLSKEFAKDPETQADNAMKTQAFKTIKNQISAQSKYTNISDPTGEALYSQAMPKLFQAIDEGRANNISMGELTDPTNKHWIGNVVQSLKRDPVQMNIDLMNEDSKPPVASSSENVWNTVPEAFQQNPTAKPTFSSIYSQYKGESDPVKKAALKKQAQDLGLVRADSTGPQVPLAQ